MSAAANDSVVVDKVNGSNEPTKFKTFPAAITNKVPGTSFVIPANFSVYVTGRYEIGAGIQVELASGATLEIG